MRWHKLALAALCAQGFSIMSLYRHVDVTQIGDVNVVCLLDREIRGEVASNELEPELNGLVSPDGAQQVLLDLSKVEFVTSSAIVQLIMLKNALAAAGARLILCALRPEVYDTFSMMRLDTLFQIESDQASGLDAFTRPAPPPPSEDAVPSGDEDVLASIETPDYLVDEAASSSATGF
jgi:anti-anti-sigma factor